MRFIGGGDEVGFIALGQHAHGFIAIGQEAIGFIAIGQLARGVFAAGQLAVGVFTAGQLSFGIGWAAMGIGGNGVLALRLVPSLEPPREYPPCTSFEAVQAGWGDGWVDAEVAAEVDGTVSLHAGGHRLPVKLAAGLVPRSKALLATPAGGRVLAHLRRFGSAFVCDRMISVPLASHLRPGFWGWLVVRWMALTALAVVVWIVSLGPVLGALGELF